MNATLGHLTTHNIALFMTSNNNAPTRSPTMAPNTPIATKGPTAAITSLILCGGSAVRMGGLDKPLELWHGQTLVAHALSRLPANSEVLISANRNRPRYTALGWPVIADSVTDYGPLGGIAAVMPHLNTQWLYVVPGDAPLLPIDLAPAMRNACMANHATACCVRTTARQPLPLLVNASALESLPAYLERGERSVGGWLNTLGAFELDWLDDTAAFANFNTPADFER